MDAIRSGITISMATSRIMKIGVTRDALLYSLICFANVLIIAGFLSCIFLSYNKCFVTSLLCMTASITRYGMARYNVRSACCPAPDSASSYLK